MKIPQKESLSVSEALEKRRSCRNYKTTPVDTGLVEELIDKARRTPTAGNSQGVEFLVLSGEEEVASYWNITLEKEKRSGFPWPGLLHAPVLVIPYGLPEKYLSRYQEIDKASSGLGEDISSWPIPYWIVDAASATTALQLLVVANGLSCCFFGQFQNEEKVSEYFSVPSTARAIGTLAIGWAAEEDRQSQSAKRKRRELREVIHFGKW